MANLRIRASLDKTEFDKGLDSIKNAAKGLNQSIQGLGAVGGVIAGVFGGNLITGAITRLFDTLMSKISESREEMIKLGHDSENIGIKPAELEDVLETFRRFGVAGDEVVAMFGRMESAREAAIAGNKDMIKAFAELGVNMDALTKKSPQGLFDTLMSRNAALGGSGSAADAMKTLFGKGMRSAGMQRGSLAYGAGFRQQEAIGVSDEAVIAEKLAEQKSHSFWQSFGNFMNKPVPGIGGLSIPGAPGLLGVSQDDIAKEQAEVQKANEKKQKDRLDAAERARQRKAEQEAALAEEDKRYAKDQQAMREDEIKNGVRLDRPESDSLQKRGLVAGGGAVNSQAYSIGRQQVSIAQQSLEMLRRIDAHTAVQAKHKAALEQIKNKFSGIAEEGDGVQ